MIIDIVLYNNADGNYEITIMTKAILHSDGLVIWVRILLIACNSIQLIQKKFQIYSTKETTGNLQKFM